MNCVDKPEKYLHNTFTANYSGNTILCQFYTGLPHISFTVQ